MTSNQWVSLAERMPPANCPRLLVTNNVNARDAIGHASHLWLVHMVHKYADGTFGAFTDHDLKLHGLTHWRYAVPEDAGVGETCLPSADQIDAIHTDKCPLWPGSEVTHTCQIDPWDIRPRDATRKFRPR